MQSELVRIPAGDFLLGSDRHYPEEAPAHRVRAAAFQIQRALVTNREFAEFVRDTGYVTVAERALDAGEYPHMTVEQRAAGSLVFRESEGPVDLRNWRLWWEWRTGANWRHPFGAGSNIAGLGDHPVVQVSYADASTYAHWAGLRLPTEKEWERAARGGADGLDFAWGSELHPDGRVLANTWQGEFPYRNNGAAGWRGTSPVGSFPANGYGLCDMIGNVWEWTSSIFTANHRKTAAAPEASVAERTGGDGSEKPVTGGCSCGPGDTKGSAHASAAPNPSIRRATKGGSHLCAPEYCQRYRPAARSPQTEDSATTNLGFRCAADA